MKTLLKIVLRLFFRIFHRVLVRGSCTVAPGQKLLVIANHESFLDGLLLGLFLPLPQEPVYVVHTSIACKWRFRLVLMLIDYLAVDPANPMAIKKVVRLVESGRPVVIFPEGRLTMTGALMKVYDGPAFVAARTGATVLPVRLDGFAHTYFSRMGGGRFRRRYFPQLSMTILPTTSVEMPAQGKARERRRIAGEQMRRIMQHMLFASMPVTTLWGAYLRAMATHGRSCPILEDSKLEEISYGKVLQMSLALGLLVRRSVPVGQRVGVLLPNASATFGTVLGASAFRCVPAMLNYTAGGAGMVSACRVAEVKTVMSSRAFVEKAALHEAIEMLSANGIQVLYLEDLRPTLSWLDKLRIAALSAFPRSLLKKADPNDAAVVLFTSGSEGVPKGVVHSHRSLLANITQIEAVISITVEDKVMNPLPMFHAFGLTGGTLLPILSGARTLLYPSPLHYRVIPELVYDQDCTVLFGTSTFLGNYARFAHPYDFYRLRYVVAGAERLAAPVRDVWFEKFGIRILEGYGATETAPVLAVNTPMAYRTGTVGQFLPGIEYRLESVPGIEEGGLLHVKGANVMSGYLLADQPGKLVPCVSEMGPGWYATGDIVTLDAEGFVSIRGRLKRFAKVAGEMVSLEQTEKLARLAAPDAEHASSSREDAARGEAIVLFTTAMDLSAERLQNVARQAGINTLALPREIRVVHELPLLGTGKTDYVKLKQMAAMSA